MVYWIDVCSQVFGPFVVFFLSILGSVCYNEMHSDAVDVSTQRDAVVGEALVSKEASRNPSVGSSATQVCSIVSRRFSSPWIGRFYSLLPFGFRPSQSFPAVQKKLKGVQSLLSECSCATKASGSAI